MSLIEPTKYIDDADYNIMYVPIYISIYGDGDFEIEYSEDKENLPPHP